MPRSNIWEKPRKQLCLQFSMNFKNINVGHCNYAAKITKLKNFLGNQIWYFHFHFSTWINISTKWKKWHKVNQLELKLMKFSRHMYSLSKHMYSAYYVPDTGSCASQILCHSIFALIPWGRNHCYRRGNWGTRRLGNFYFRTQVSLAAEWEALIIKSCSTRTAYLMSNINPFIPFGGN